MHNIYLKSKGTWLFAAFLAVAVLLAAAAWAHQPKAAPSKETTPYPVVVTKKLVEQGRAIFKRQCAVCHRTKSTRQKVGPGLKGLFKKELTPAMKHPVSEGNIRGHIQQGGDKMPAFPQITGRGMDALIAYLKTL